MPFQNGLPFLPPGDLLNPGINTGFDLESPALADGFFTTVK